MTTLLVLIVGGLCFAVLFAVTEKRTRDEMDAFVAQVSSL